MIKVTIETDASIYEYDITNEMAEQFPEEYQRLFAYPIFLSYNQDYRDKV